MTSEDAWVRRLLIQHLESWRQAGLTHLGRCSLEPANTATSPSLPASASPLPVADSDSELGPDTAPLPNDRYADTMKTPRVPTSASGRQASESTLFVAEQSQATTSGALAVPVRTPQSLDERKQLLQVLAERVAGCRRCDELARTRTQTVFGVGNPEARIMFIGEAPGADEDRQGEPFVGRAGQLLNKIIEAMHLTREEIYICNILRCRPPGNRTPLPEEAAHCREFLDGQISIIDPEYIVCWGTCAAQNLLNVTDTIGKMRSRFYLYGRARVLCTYHPSYLLRNPAAKKDVWQDMQFLMKELGIPVD